ncbi:MAG TPA: hypothetical protein VND65_14795 [Candidatus Binatia bacterium]|nr:hypothetical protein [Candidatus Binatia bacterium]
MNPTAGPVTICSSSQYGCNNEYGNTQSWTNNPQYIDFYLTAVQGWIGGGSGTTMSCGNPSGTSSQADQAWFNMSILATGGDTTYNSTSMGDWVCAGPASNYQSGTCGNSHCPNNSGSQGALFGQQFYSGHSPQPHYVFVGVNTCYGEEGVTGTYATTPNGENAMSAIEADMKTHCSTN